MTSLRDLLQRRDQLRTDLQAIIAAHPDGTLPDEVRQRADEIEAEAARLNEMERRQVLLDDLARSAPGRPLDNRSDRSELRVFSDATSRIPEGFDGQIWRASDGSRVPILEQRHKLSSFIAPETPAAELGLSGFLRCLRYGAKNELERRVMGEASVGAGGALVPSPLAAEVIDLLRPQNVALRAGARIVPMTTQTLRFARETADPVGGWRAENAALPTSQPTFTTLTLQAQAWAVIVQASRELLEDAPNVDSALRNIFARVTALALDQAILFGTGHANNQP
jgi:HK97 family phage major capsid protein